jgi:hypothetical protein
MIWINPIDKIKPDYLCKVTRQTTVTVITHGKKGFQDMVLRNQGYILMDFNSDRRREQIGDKGEAKFSNVGIGDTVHLNIEFTEPFQSTKPDSNYIIEENKNIYVEVALQGLGQVEGKVLFREEPLSGVVVSIGELRDTTRENGHYKIIIPDSLQKKKYLVWFDKKGFSSRSAPAFPENSKDLDMVMEKSH